MIKLESDAVMTLELLARCVDDHRAEVSRRLKRLDAMYRSDHDILHRRRKEAYKPDNRIVVNFAKYIVDTMNGFFIGNPLKVLSEDAGVSDFLGILNQYNDFETINAELAKLCDVFGCGYEIYFTDEDGMLCAMFVSPMDGFMIIDDSILERPRYFVRLWTDRYNIEHGSISDDYGVRYFRTTGGYAWEDDDWAPHYFGDVPATEYKENAERTGIFEPAVTMINAYNKAISEKANDVDYFADCYLKILGADLDEDGLRSFRDNRTINMPDGDGNSIVVDFLAKPSADTTQENLIDRLERLIFEICMVANIGNEQFGTSSGIAMRYKLQGMSNLAMMKKTRFIAGLNRRYRLLFGHPGANVPDDAWLKLSYVFTPNVPANLAEEAETAAKLEGVVSKSTQLGTLSIVDNVPNEIERLRSEQLVVPMNDEV